MDEFGRAHAGSAVETAAFFQSAEKASGKSISSLTDAWLGGAAESKLGDDVIARHGSRRFWAVDSFERQLDKALIVYGTVVEAEIQRESAHRLQRKLASRFANYLVPIKADVDVSDPILKDAHLLLVGRPSTNRLTARLAKALPVSFGSASVRVGGETFAHPQTAIVAAGPSPLAADRSVVVFAGLGTEGLWECIGRFPDRGGANAEVMLFEAGGPTRGLAIAPPTTGDAPMTSVGQNTRDEAKAISGRVR